LVLAASKVKTFRFVSKLADEKLIGWDNARVTDDANIVVYAAKPLKGVSARDKLAEGAVEAYCKWKGGTAPFLPTHGYCAVVSNRAMHGIAPTKRHRPYKTASSLQNGACTTWRRRRDPFR
jgi:hypothetical protein